MFCHPVSKREPIVGCRSGCGAGHVRSSIDTGKSFCSGVTAGQLSEQITCPAAHVEQTVGSGSGGHSESGGAVGDLVMQPAPPAAVVSGGTIVERGDVPI